MIPVALLFSSDGPAIGSQADVEIAASVSIGERRIWILLAPLSSVLEEEPSLAVGQQRVSASNRGAEPEFRTACRFFPTRDR